MLAEMRLCRLGSVGQEVNGWVGFEISTSRTSEEGRILWEGMDVRVVDMC